MQNADDNIYPEHVDPTIVFILQDTGIVILNNEQGFSAQNIRALCDIGQSTKKGSSAGYIGRKGIGFKSVFRVGLKKLLYLAVAIPCHAISLSLFIWFVFPIKLPFDCIILTCFTFLH